jgi:hypothetical protein
MKKKLQQRDLSKTVKVKLVKLFIGDQNNFGQSNRFYFTNDAQLDQKIIVGIVAHVGNSAAGPFVWTNGIDVPFATIYNPVTNYEDDYFTGLISQLGSGVVSQAYLSLVNTDGRYFWYQQPLSSLSLGNNKRYPKRLYSRLILDKCYIEVPFAFTSGIAGVPITNYQLFSFYYIDDPNL